jgi:hypothetical protein
MSARRTSCSSAFDALFAGLLLTTTGLEAIIASSARRSELERCAVRERRARRACARLGRTARARAGMSRAMQ